MTKDERVRLPFYIRLISNWVGIGGAVLFATAFVSFLFLLLVELSSGHTSPYLGFFHYLVIPAIGAVGIALLIAGWWLDRRRRSAGVTRQDSLGAIDIRRTGVQQRVLVTMGVATGALVFFMALGGQRAFHYSESNEFCGAVCHAVMEPEYVAHQRSPHANVGCVDCHVGEGLEYFVAAKLRGVHQVIAVLRDNYERPIPTPVADMRDSKDICESCHWGARDVGQVHRGYTYYSSEGMEEPWQLDLLLNAGGVDPVSGEIRGIHWHTNEPNRVEYVARDDRRQDIPWVRVTDIDGRVTVYRNTESPPEEGLESSGELRTMECLDCHNRPAHQLKSPIALVNRAIAAGVIDVGLPEIKFTALEALANEYDTREEARAGVREWIETFYADVYPEVLEEDGESLETAIVALQGLYGDQFFPEMKARWSAYPDNSRHWTAPGCFRCHGGLHQSDDGRTISADCATCHTVIRQGMRDSIQLASAGDPLLHPWDEEIMEAPILCSECHDGVLGLGR